MNLQHPAVDLEGGLKDIFYMRMAVKLAQQAASEGEVPVGAVIVRNGAVLGRAHNQVELLKDPTAHAEIIAITQAANAVRDWRLLDTTLYITKEPCPMCAGAVVNARIPRVVWGMSDPLRGGAVSQFKILNSLGTNHRAECTPGVLEEECTELMRSFFQSRRGRARE